MAFKVYLFDLDDTLISTKIYAKMYKPVLSMIKKKFKLTSKQLDEKALSLGLEKNKFGRWDTGDLCRELNLLEEYYKILEQEIDVLPVLSKNVIKVFKKIKPKRIGIVSNSMSRTINAYLNKYKLKKYLDLVYSRDDAKSKKKEPIYWKKLIKKHHLKPKECLFIGDDPEQDIKMAEKFEFNTFLIETPKDLLRVPK